MGNAAVEKSFEYGVEIVKAVRKLRNESREYELASQLLRSGTSVGANIAEAQKAQTGKDFIAKMSIALKEANESMYWIRLLAASEVITQESAAPLIKMADELNRILTSIIKTKQENLRRK